MLKPKIRLYRLPLFVLLFQLLSLQSLYPQGMFRGSQSDRKRSDQLHHEALILPASHPDSLAYHFYVTIDRNLLQFVLNTDDQYHAKYEMTAAVILKDRKILTNQIRLGEIIDIKAEDNGSAKTGKVEFFRFTVPTIPFTLYLELFDQETRRSVYSEHKITPPEMKYPGLSQLFFTNQKQLSIEVPSNLKPVFPVARNETDSTLKALVYISTNNPGTTYLIRRTLATTDGRAIIDDTSEVTPRHPVEPLFVHLPVTLDFGSYLLKIEFLNAPEPLIVQRTFFVKWGETSSWMPNLTLAIESLIHVADKDEIQETLTRPRTVQEDWLKQFWQSRNPNPDNEDNPLQEEYYRRVTTANKQFSAPGANRPGWKTDRGYVFIVYGAPTDIDRPRAEFGDTSRYEVWFYRNIHKRFVFMDKFGNGNYRLVSQE